jgi:hypothetical protein
VQGITNAFRDSGVLNNEYQVEFKKTIPAGAETCLFEIIRKNPNESDKWEEYSKILEEKALEK